jgi:hypothetical protein
MQCRRRVQHNFAFFLGSLVMATLLLAGCRKTQKPDEDPLYQAGMWSDTIQKLHSLDVGDTEITEVLKAHQAGFPDDDCVEVVRLARGRKKMFSDGDAIAGLLHVGVSETNVLALARLDQLGVWAADLQGIRLAGYSDQVVMAVARHRAAGLATVSGVSLVELKNTGVSEQQVLAQIDRGLSDEQAGQMIAEHQHAEMPRGFVRKASSSKRQR